MEQGINLGIIAFRRKEANRSFEESCKLALDAGFRNLDYLTSCVDDDYSETARRQREFLDHCGLTVHQSHCPFFRYQKDGLELFKKYAPRAVENAAILGAKFLVFHADEIRAEGSFDAEDIFKRNVELLKPLVDRCVELGIRPAIENLFEDKCFPEFDGRSRYTSKTEEVLAVIDAFSGSGIGCCWDAGHAQVAYGKTALDELERLASHVVCTHMHDNSYGHDMHKPAFFGNMDWERAMGILNAAGYQGNFTWEFVYERFPEPLVLDYLRFVHRLGEYLTSL